MAFRKKTTAPSPAAIETATEALASARATLSTATTARDATAAAKARSCTLDTSLAANLAAQDALVAEAVVREKEIALATLLDARDVAAGDEDLVASDPSRFVVAMGDLLETEGRLVAQLEDIERQRAALAANAKAAAERADAKRRAAGLPVPVASLVMRNRPAAFGEPLPRGGRPGDAIAALVTKLDGFDADRPKTTDERLAALKREEREIRLDIARADEAERQRREDDARRRAEYEREQERRNQERKREHEAWVAKVQAQQEEEERLLAAQRAREASRGGA